MDDSVRRVGSKLGLRLWRGSDFIGEWGRAVVLESLLDVGHDVAAREIIDETVCRALGLLFPLPLSLEERAAFRVGLLLSGLLEQEIELGGPPPGGLLQVLDAVTSGERELASVDLVDRLVSVDAKDHALGGQGTLDVRVRLWRQLRLFLVKSVLLLLLVRAHKPFIVNRAVLDLLRGE